MLIRGLEACTNVLEQAKTDLVMGLNPNVDDLVDALQWCLDRLDIDEDAQATIDGMHEEINDLRKEQQDAVDRLASLQDQLEAAILDCTAEDSAARLKLTEVLKRSQLESES